MRVVVTRHAAENGWPLSLADLARRTPAVRDEQMYRLARAVIASHATDGYIVPRADIVSHTRAPRVAPGEDLAR